MSDIIVVTSAEVNLSPDDPRTKKVPIADQEMDSGRTVVATEADDPGVTPGQGQSGQTPHQDFGRFEVIELLGMGSMGRVWRARDPLLDREVAVKEILGDHPELIARFQQEARAQARVHHPHVCTVYEVGEVDGRPFIAMELLVGRTLDRVAPSMSVEELTLLIRLVAEAVHAAHRNGLIHRDIKPANIMVSRMDDGSWWPWVTDFGLARDIEGPGLTIGGATIGTPSFMPPEQATGRPEALDARADVYSLGATFFAALAGRPPFVAESAGEMILKVIQDEVPPLGRLGVDVPKDLESVVVKCLEKDPGRRYGGADELAEDLGRFLSGTPVRARPAGPVLRAAKTVRRNKVTSALIGLAVVVTLVLGTAWWHAVLQGRQEADLASEFDTQVRFVEDSVRHALTAPLHDVREELNAARSRLLAVEIRVEEAGQLATGPGHAALGRGYLALHDYPSAKMHLETAWNAGARHPEIAVAFGRTLAVLFLQRRAEVEWKEEVERERALDRARVELGDPARKLLEKGRGVDIESPELVEALLASCEKRWPDAVSHASKAHERLPWLYDARVLEGESWREWGRELFEVGENTRAEEAFDSAEDALRRAVSYGRSDPAVFLSLCDLGLKRAELGLFGTGGNLERLIMEALSDCGRAATADPDSAEVAIGRSALWVRMAEWRLERREDPTEALDRTVTAAQEALSLAPGSSDPSIRLASAAVLRAQYRMALDKDPSEDLDRAVQWFEHALEQEPSRLEALANLGKAHWLGAGWVTQAGGDPRAHFERAVHAYDRAAEVSPESALVRNNLGATWYQRASWEIREGIDAAESLQRAVEEFEEARKLNPGLALASLNLAGMYSMRADLELNRDGNPQPAWDRSVAAYRRCLEIQCDHVVALNRLVLLYFKRGNYLKEHGFDPSTDFDAAVKVALQSRDATPNDGSAIQRLGVALLRREILGSGADGDFDRARSMLLEAVESNSKRAGPIADFAEALAEDTDDTEKTRCLRLLGAEIRRAGAGDDPKTSSEEPQEM